MDYIPMNDNIADVFMKALARPKFMGLVESLGLGELGKKGGEQ